MTFSDRLLASASALLVASLPASASARDASLELFEDAVPPAFKAERGQLALSSAHAKDGEQSLQWTWREGGKLTIARPFEFRPFVPNPTDQRRLGIGLWLYNGEARDGAYRFDFYRGQDRVAGFSVKADFTGWRAAVLAFEGDMDGQPVEGMDRLVISPPKGAGQSWIDEMAFDLRVDPRHPAADYQLPGLNPKVMEMANSHWTGLLEYDRQFERGTSAPAATPAASPDVAADIRAIGDRIDADLIEGKAADLSAVERQFAALHNPGGALKPLSQTAQQWSMYEAAGVDNEPLAVLRSTTVTWRDFGRFMKTVAIAYRKSKSEADRSRLAAIFSLLVRHQVDQGLVRGSGQGIMHHQGYSLGDWAAAQFLMRDAMGSDVGAARAAIGWYAGLGRIYEPMRADSDFNADVMNTLIQPMLFAILMESNGERQRKLLADYSRWVSASTLLSPGTGGGIKPDGSVFHHSQHYPAYGNGALTGLAGVVRFLSGTGYQLTFEAHDRIRHAVMATRLFSSQGKVLMSLTGRHADGEQAIVLAPFRYLAMAGAPGQAGDGPDPVVASAFLRLMTGNTVAMKPTPADRAAAARLRNAGIVAEADPAGSWVLPYSSLVLRRGDGWLLGARGFSRYLVGNESYSKDNLFGRYINYGALEFLPADPARRGFAMAGWDWNRWPGTTAVRLPLEKLRARPTQVDIDSGVEEMLLSEESYSGGLDFQDSAALFAMKLQGHPKYGDDLVARKSVFFFGDRAIVLGSGISASVADAPVQTTIFQDQVGVAGGKAWLEGLKAGARIPETRVHLSGWLAAADEHGNGMCLAPGQDVLFGRTDQTSIDETGAKPTEGRFSTLVIDHGAVPRGAGYEYAFLVGAGPKGAQRFCGAMRSRGKAAYRVLARDERAHIVADKDSGLTGYAIFEAGAVAVPGIMISVSAPSMLMLRADHERVEGVFANPDLNLYQGRDPQQYDSLGERRERSVYALDWRMHPSRPVTTTVVFKGRWRLDGSATQTRSRYDRGNTVVEFETVDGVPVKFSLVKG